MPSWDFQRTVAAVILDVTQEDGFALAGSGAIREHGLTDRPTRDVDLFTINVTEARFTDAVGHAMAALSEHGYDALLTRSASLFARLIVTEGDEQLEVDLGVDWRGHDPVVRHRPLAWRDRIVHHLMPRVSHDVWQTIEHRPGHRPDPPGHHRPSDRGVPI